MEAYVELLDAIHSITSMNYHVLSAYSQSNLPRQSNRVSSASRCPLPMKMFALTKCYIKNFFFQDFRPVN